MVRILLMVLIAIISQNQAALGDGINDYLLLNDIGSYKISTPEKLIPGFQPIGGPRVYDGPGIIGATGHFPDDRDVTYEVMYIGGGGLASPTVQVTQHAGSDSDKWLLHEVEDGYRSDEVGKLGLPTKGMRLRQMGGCNVISLRGSGYSWIRNNVVVDISYTDLYGTKPEPLEVVQAYLQKFPSTISPAMVLDRAHDEQWIKDEMERRLWLCDKWVLQVQMGKIEIKDALQIVVKYMDVFLDYRQKYYRVAAADEKAVLWGFLDKKDGTGIKNKLAEYKSWWNVNKTRSINLP